MPPDERIRRAYEHRPFPGGVCYRVLKFLHENTVPRRYNTRSAAEREALQAMATRAIGLTYRNWGDFQQELHYYLEKFGYADFSNDARTSVSSGKPGEQRPVKSRVPELATA